MQLVLIRSGKTFWDEEKKYTGWTDVPLSEDGIEEAKKAGKILKETNINFGIAYTSVLSRATDTLNYIMEELGTNLKVRKSYKLNERHYGALQGLYKDETKAQYGEEQVHLWRRGYDVRPPELDISDSRFPGNDPLYKDILKFDLPLSESLKDTYNRVVDYFDNEISTFLKVGENVLVVAHGNSLRALIKYLENISDEDIMGVELDNGVPIIYELDDELKIISKKEIA